MLRSNGKRINVLKLSNSTMYLFGIFWGCILQPVGQIGSYFKLVGSSSSLETWTFRGLGGEDDGRRVCKEKIFFCTHSKEVSLTYSKTNYDCNTMHTNPTESKGVKVYQVEFGNMKQF